VSHRDFLPARIAVELPVPTAPARKSLGKRILENFGLARKRPARLPISGLPEGFGEVPRGEVALLLSPDATGREQLVLALLEKLLPDQRVTWICTASRTPDRVSNEIQVAVADSRLRVMTWTADAALQLRALGDLYLLRELATSGTTERDVLVLDAFDPWLAEVVPGNALEAPAADATRALLRWSAEHEGPVFAFAPLQHNGQSLLPFLGASRIPRLAVLRQDEEFANLEVFRWGHARRGTAKLAPARFALQPNAGKGWQCLLDAPRQEAPGDSRNGLIAEDLASVHAVRSAVLDTESFPKGWRIFPTLDALLAEARQATAATVVLDYDHPDSMAAIADAVHRLRTEHPHLLKIVVRETEAAMRKNGELALLRLGANLVASRALSFTQLAHRIADLRDEIFQRPPVANAARAVQTLTPEPLQGYLPPLLFCAVVERTIERTAHVRLEHSLVHLPLLPHVAHIDALMACCARRDGDIVSTDTGGLYLFLFGCAAEDAMAALDSIFTVPCGELAHSVQIDPAPNAQFAVLGRLRRAAEENPSDYSAILRGLEAAGRASTVQAAVLPTRSAEQVRCVQAHVLPLRETAA
jgi:cellulose biosynthesis protein BcsE